jgi:dolichyl-phosphate-mannose-protein mannosyltransferase/DUF2993 family protein
MSEASRREWALLLSAFVLVVAVAAVWTAVDRRPPEWDHANHLERAIDCAHDLAAGDVASMLERSSFYPPLVLCAAGASYRLWPSDVFAAQLVVWLFLGLGMVATYLLGRRVADGTVGVAAAILFATAPFVIFSTLRFQLDLPLAAMVALALYTISTTESFTRRGPALVAGVVTGLGMLTKPTFAVYVLPAVLLALRDVRRPRLLNALLGAIVAVLVSAAWYAPRALGMLAQVGARSGKQAAEAGQPGAFTWAGLSLYPRWFVPQFGALAVLLCFAGLAIAVRHRQGLVIVSVLAPFVLVELIQNKNLRYTLPILPAASILAALVLGSLRGHARSVLMGAIGVAAIVQMSATAFGIPRFPSLPWLDVPWLLDSSPIRDDWRQREILALLARESRGAPATVSVVPNGAYFSVSNFRYYALRDGSPLRWARAWDDEPIGIAFMILKTGDQGPTWTAEKPRRIAERLGSDVDFARVFPVIGTFPLPDGSIATVRARRVPPYPAPASAIVEAIDAAVRRGAPEFARDVDGLGVALEGTDDITHGRVGRLVLTARAATLGEFRRRHTATLRVHDVRLAAEDVLLNPWTATSRGRLELLDAGRIVIERATVTEEDLAAFLANTKGFERTTVRFEDGAATVRLGRAWPDVTSRVRILHATNRPFALAADDVRVGGVPIPSPLVNWVLSAWDPSPRLAARLPIRVEIGQIGIANGAIEIRATGERAKR